LGLTLRALAIENTLDTAANFELCQTLHIKTTFVLSMVGLTG